MSIAFSRRGAVGLTVLVIGLGGCGNGDEVKRENAYVDQVNVAQGDFAKTVDRLSDRITAKSSPRQDKATLEGFQGAVDRVVTRLRTVTPPSSVTALHRRLVGAIAAYGREVRGASRSLSSSDPDKLIVAQQRLLTATSTVSSRINATIARINATLRKD